MGGGGNACPCTQIRPTQKHTDSVFSVLHLGCRTRALESCGITALCFCSTAVLSLLCRSSLPSNDILSYPQCSQYCGQNSPNSFGSISHLISFNLFAPMSHIRDLTRCLLLLKKHSIKHCFFLTWCVRAMRSKDSGNGFFFFFKKMKG